MKVALVLASNKALSPYVLQYEFILKKLSVDYDIITWNRAFIKEPNCIAFTAGNKGNNPWAKIYQYFQYTAFLRKELSERKYDRVVVFTIFQAILLSGFLIKSFSKQYVFDIRDHSGTIKVFNARLRATIAHAYATVISSPGFKTWLPTGFKYYLNHNLPPDRRTRVASGAANTGISAPVTILTIGSLRDAQANKDLIASFANDVSYKLKYVGYGPAEPELKAFVEKEGIDNVTFYGPYKKEDELTFLSGVALINAVLPDDINSRTLLTNRLYLAAGNYIPIMVNAGSEQAAIVLKFGTGVVVEKQDVRAQVKNYLDGLDMIAFRQNCDKFLAAVAKDQDSFAEMIKEFVRH